MTSISRNGPNIFLNLIFGSLILSMGTLSQKAFSRSRTPGFGAGGVCGSIGCCCCCVGASSPPFGSTTAVSSTVTSALLCVLLLLHADVVDPGSRRGQHAGRQGRHAVGRELGLHGIAEDRREVIDEGVDLPLA